MRKKKNGQLGIAPCESYPTSMRAICRVVEEKQYRKIARSPTDRVNMDGATANAIMTVYDALNPANREKFAALPMRKMATVAWKLLK